MKAHRHNPSDRYQTIDALRGVAAVAVAIYHLFTPAFAETNGPIKALIGAAARYGYLGVPLFFVISGFVIASTVNQERVTYRFVGKFAIKRSLRLDPPYWISMVIDLAFLWSTLHIFHKATKAFPPSDTIIAHLFYLQDLLGLGQISDIYWTLCLEIQFYLFFVLVFATANTLRATKMGGGDQFVFGAFLISLAYSLLILAGVLKTPLSGLFLPNWYLFMLGAMCQIDMPQKKASGAFISLALLVCGGITYKWSHQDIIDYYALTGVFASTFIYVAKRQDKLSSWLNWSPLLFLGSISYSLYLFHAIVGERFIALSKLILAKLEIGLTADWQAMLLLVIALCVSSAFALAIYKLVERPSMLLSKKIKPENNTGILSELQNKQGSAQLVSS